MTNNLASASYFLNILTDFTKKNIQILNLCSNIMYIENNFK